MTPNDTSAARIWAFWAFSAPGTVPSNPSELCQSTPSDQTIYQLLQSRPQAALLLGALACQLAGAALRGRVD